MAKQRPTWLVITRLGGLIAAVGLVVALLGFAFAFGLAQAGIYIALIGGAVALVGVLYRFAKGAV